MSLTIKFQLLVLKNSFKNTKNLSDLRTSFVYNINESNRNKYVNK